MDLETNSLNKLDRAVLAAGGDSLDLLDRYNYPSREGVRKVAAAIGKDLDDEDALTDVYYSIKFLTRRTRQLAQRGR